MSKAFRTLFILAEIAFVISAYGSRKISSHTEQPLQATVVYTDLLGKTLNDKFIANFLATHDCSREDQYLLCKGIGMALWISANQVVKIVYLYLNNSDDFAPYNGELPYGLKFYDTLGSVEYKLKRKGIGNNGLPDTTATPDHMHYHATYQEVGMTVIYNSPFPDEDATIHKIFIIQ